MPSSNVIQFSSASVANSIKKGNAILGVNVGNYGPTSTTGFWNGITPPSGGYTIYVSRSTAGPNIYTPTTDSELITYSSKLANIPFTTTASALAWFATQSNSIVVNKNYPDIVTSSSILMLDASFTPSYPTTNSIWYDISGNNYTGSLTNGPVFNSRGYFNFDGTDDYVAIPNELALTLNGNPGATLEMVLLLKKRDNSSGQSGLTQLSGFNNTNGNLYFYANFGDGTGGLFLDVFRNSRVTIPTSSLSSKTVNPLQWHQLNITTTPGANGWKVYWNGELKYSDTGLSQVYVSSSTYTPSFSSSIGDLTFGKSSGTRELSGSIASYKLYNRTLSQSEILQNYYQAPITTNGLVFTVDAGNLVSYESGSTTTYSLTGSASGSLINGVGYNSGDGGNWTFDGVDDFIQCTGSFTVTEATFVTWIRRNGDQGQYDGILFSRGTNTTGINFQSSNQLGYHWNDTAATYNWASGLTIPNLTWCMIAVSVSANSATAYLYQTDGTTTSTNTTSHASSVLNAINLARDSAGSRFFNGNIAISQLYNRALSTSEITQNFNAQRQRFGI
jgi:hypothetical protein